MIGIKRKPLTITEKDFLASFIIAIIVGLVFYFNNLGCASTELDVYWIEFGMIMPFILPLFFLFKILWSKPRRLKHG